MSLKCSFTIFWFWNMCCRSTFQCRHCRMLRNTSIIPFVARSPSVWQVEICMMEWGSSIQTPENGPCLVQNLVYFDNCSQWDMRICQILCMCVLFCTLEWRHSGCDGVSNHQPHQCLLTRLFRRRLKKTSKLHVTSLCAGNSPVTTGEFPAQMASNEENVSIW